MEKLLKILAELRPEIDFEAENDLIDDGILDSFDIIALIGEIENSWGVSIGLEEMIPENFNSVSAILSTIERLCK